MIIPKLHVVKSALASAFLIVLGFSSSKGWDFGWVMVRTDGVTARRICDPHTLKFNDSKSNHAMRWFVR